MKIKLGVFLLAALLLFLEACSSSSTYVDNFLPQTIGEYKRSEVEINGSYYTAEYQKEPSGRISYSYEPKSSAQEAQTRTMNEGLRQSADSMNKGASKILKEEVLKDKTGKKVGKILVCRDLAVSPYKDQKVGNYEYSIIFSNGKDYVSLNGRESSLADLINFLEILPLNSQVNFPALDLKALIAANSSTSTSASELLKLNPPVKLAKEPYIKGKVLIARQTYAKKSSSENPYELFTFDESFKEYGLTQDLIADTYNEAETIIQIACSKGEKIGDYVTKDAAQRKLPAYASNCKVSVIDKTIPAVIAQKNLVGKFMSNEERFYKDNNIFHASPPYEEIHTFVKSLPKR